MTSSEPAYQSIIWRPDFDVTVTHYVYPPEGRMELPLSAEAQQAILDEAVANGLSPSEVVLLALAALRDQHEAWDRALQHVPIND